MKHLEFTVSNIPNISEDIALCLGYFDGVHIGHKSMIEIAKNEGYKVAVLTFDNNPDFVIGKIDSNKLLSPLEKKEQLFARYGADYLLTIHFDLEFSKLSSIEFINKVLRPLSPKVILCGNDYRFAFKGSGTIDDLKQYFNVHVIPFITFDDKKISSTSIINLLKSNDVKTANKMLGYNYSIKGKVITGLRNGVKLGFPTANVINNDYVMPGIGVYACHTYVDGIKYKGMLNIGTHPTLDQLENNIYEVNIFDFDRDIYGKEIEIELIDFIRPEKKFNSVDDLISELKRNKIQCEELLK